MRDESGTPPNRAVTVGVVGAGLAVIALCVAAALTQDDRTTVGIAAATVGLTAVFVKRWIEDRS